MPLDVELDTTDLCIVTHQGIRALILAKVRLDTKKEFLGREGLDDIIVTSARETDPFIHDVTFCGEEDDRNGHVVFPQFPTNLKSIDLRHHHIED
jgi:hypothetical protein